MISVVCVYNDKATLDSLLLASLARQDAAFDLTCLDNTSGQYACAATALNEAGRGAANDIVMFVHQDVELLSPMWLADAERMGRSLGPGATAGVGGVDDRGRGWSSVWSGNPRRVAGGHSPTSPTAVQTLDGCLVIVFQDAFTTTRFDADTCSGWHLYVADYCLSRRRSGHTSFVLPLPVYHRSMGPAANVLQDTANAIVRKHVAHSPRIVTTVGELTPISAPRRLWARARKVLGRLRTRWHPVAP